MPPESARGKALANFDNEAAAYDATVVRPPYAKVTSLGGADVRRHAGGVFELAMHNPDRMWRTEALLKVGRMKFEKGGTASDQIWAALLSLEDGDELVAAATKLDWQFQPRGMHNVDLHRRYGDAIVRWIAARIDASGVLHSHPWCVMPCLLACGDVTVAIQLAGGARRASHLVHLPGSRGSLAVRKKLRGS